MDHNKKNRFAWLLLLCLASMPALALDPGLKPLPHPVKLRACIFDPAGKNGPAANIARDLMLDALRWGLQVELRTFTDERVAADEFKAGQCELAGMSTLRARQFSRAIGSIDAPGNLRSGEEVKSLLRVLAHPDFMPFSIFGRYQVIGVIPIGTVYLMVRDRSQVGMDKLAGRRIAVLDWDPAQARMVSALGAQPVPSDITSFGGKFNNGQVDIIAAPALAYEPLELSRGIGSKGGIIRFPVFQATATVLMRRDLVLPLIPDMDERMLQLRSYGLRFINDFMKTLERTEARIPASAWIALSPEERQRYARALREARLTMTREGVYDTNIMHLLRRVRCKHEASHEECNLFDE